LKSESYDKFIKKWFLFLVILILVAPIVGIVSEHVGSSEPLDHVAEVLGLSGLKPLIKIFPDYLVPFIPHFYLSNLFASLLGFFIVVFVSMLIGKLLSRRK